MGYGDAMMASGIARGAKDRGKRIAFGDGRRIVWGPADIIVFKGNPNVAPPGAETANDVEWVKFYTGNRFYGKAAGGRWQFQDYRPIPGEVYLSDEEEAFGETMRGLSPLVLIEPNVKAHGACVGANKQWPIERYQEVASQLSRDACVVQMVGPNPRVRLSGIQILETPSYRHALSVMRRAALYIGPEGGLHHGAAAMATRAVVIFGGFNTPLSTGYDWHVNLVASGKPCGNMTVCSHCRNAMASISVQEVVSAATAELAMPEARRA